MCGEQVNPLSHRNFSCTVCYLCKTATNFSFHFHFINSDPLSKIPQFFLNKLLTMLFFKLNLLHPVSYNTKFSRTVKYKSPITILLIYILLHKYPKFNYEQLLPEIIINVSVNIYMMLLYVENVTSNVCLFGLVLIRSIFLSQIIFLRDNIKR